MAYVNQQFFGTINAESINNQNIVILEGNFAAGSPNITSITYTGDKNWINFMNRCVSPDSMIKTEEV